MKEDVLEQIVDDYLQHQGFLTTNNVRFRPPPEHADYIQNQDAVNSDIDVVGYRPAATNPADRVYAVSCKSWQAGFPAKRLLALLHSGGRSSGREVWKNFRELWEPKWTAGFCNRIEAVTRQSDFTYVIAVTKMTGPWDAEEAAHYWSSDPRISRALDGRPLRFLTLGQMWADVLSEVTRTTAPSEIGRMIQLLVAAGLVAMPAHPE